MARLLVRTIGPGGKALGPDEVVTVSEDGHVFGNMETPEHGFRVIDLPGVPVDELQYLTDPEYVTPRDKFPPALLGIRRLIPAAARAVRGETKQARRWRVDAAGNPVKK